MVQEEDDIRFAASLRRLLREAASAAALGESAGQDRLLEMLVQTAATVTGAAAASLLEVDAEAGNLIFRAATGPRAQEVRRFVVPLGQGIAGFVAETGEPVAIANVQEDPRFFRDIGQSIQYIPNSMLCVPVRVGDDIVGVLELLDKDGGSTFTMQDIDLVAALARQAAVAIGQSRDLRNLTGLFIRSLRTLAGAGAVPPAIEDGAAAFSRREAGRPVHAQALALASTIAALADQGEAELAVARDWLESFLSYLRARYDALLGPRRRRSLSLSKAEDRWMTNLPAWSWQFDKEHLQPSVVQEILDEISPDWAWGGSDGAGIRVAVIDSGIDSTHPEIQDAVRGWVEPIDDAGTIRYEDAPHVDSYGHGTACAGIILRLAPAAQLYSVKVLGSGLTGRGQIFAAGLRWAIEHEMNVVNMSLGTTKRDFYGLFHELADDAYFRNIMLVSAANNMPVPSFPSLYACVLSVASQEDSDPYHFAYNPAPPVDFGAPGLNVRVPWLNGSSITATGNSYAAPHIAGVVCRILAKHPGLTPFQLKTVLRATAYNLRRVNGEVPPREFESLSPP